MILFFLVLLVAVYYLVGAIIGTPNICKRFFLENKDINTQP